MQLNFNAASVQPDTGLLDPVPAGWYNVAVDQSDVKPTADQTNRYLEFRFVILDGQFKDRKLYSRFNLWNSSAQASEIAAKQLSAVCHAVNILNLADTQQLHGQPLKVRVIVRPAEGQYQAQNEIKAYRNINEQVEQPAATVPAVAHTPAPAGGWTPPAGATAPPAGNGWAQPATQAPAHAAAPAAGAAWSNPAPAATAPAATPAPAGAAPWQNPANPAPAQPWQNSMPTSSPPAGTPVANTAQAAPPLPAGANPQGALPPWQQPR